jgi:hypothetical protein
VAGTVGTTPTGTVQFYDAGIPLGSPVSLSGGSAAYVTSALALGTHNITAIYSGDATHQPATSPALPFTVVSTGTLTAGCFTYNGPATLPQGTPFTLTTQVKSSPAPGPTPSGTFELDLPFGSGVGGSQKVSGSTPFTLSFTLNTSAAPVSAGIAISQYGLIYVGSFDYTLTQTCASEPAITITGATTTSLTTTAVSPVLAGTPFTLNGGLQIQSPAGAPPPASQPAGSVNLLDNGNVIATSNFVGNTSYNFPFQINTAASPLTAGAHSFTLSYPGNGLFTGSTSAPVNLTVDAVATISLSGNVPAAGLQYVGSQVKITAAIGNLGHGAAPTGTVQFYDNGASIGAPVSILNGVASYTSSSFAVGSHSVTAVYSGSSTYGSVTSAPLTFQVVSQITDTLTLVGFGVSTAASGSPFGMEAQLNLQSVQGTPSPTGTITFKQNGAVIASVSVTGNQTNYFASVNTAAAPLTPGTHVFSATYSGDSVYPASSSGTVTVTITGNVPQFTLLSNAAGYASVVQATPVTFTATAGAVNGLPTPTGTVQFFVNGVAAGAPVSLVNGVAAYTTSSLPVGSDTITTAYSGNSSYDSTTTNGVSVVVAIVTQGSDTLAVTPPSASTVTAGTPVTLTATLNVTSLGPAPTGAVTLLDNGTPLTTATLSGNPPFALSFQLNTAAAPLAGGTHSFTLQYPGGSQWAPATTAAQTVTVSDFTLAPGTPTVTVSPGASATETLNVTYQGGLAATTTFTCSGLPSEAACTPLSVTGTGPATLTITTTGSTTARLHWLTGGGAAFACLLLFGYPLRRRKWLLLPCTLLVLSLVSLTGCGGGNGGSSGGGSGSGGGGTGGNSGTPAGTYTVTVTATTSGGPSVITHTTTYQLTVN